MGNRISIALVVKGLGLAASLGSLVAFAVLILRAINEGLGHASVPGLLGAGVILFVIGEVLRWRAGQMGDRDDTDIDADAPETPGAGTGIARPTDEAPHEAVYNDAFRRQQKRGDSALNDPERMTLHLVPLYIYIASNGVQSGVAGFGTTETRAALPHLIELGLNEVAALLEAYIAHDEDVVSDPVGLEKQLSAVGFDDIPARLDAYLETKYPWAPTPSQNTA